MKRPTILILAAAFILLLVSDSFAADESFMQKVRNFFNRGKENVQQPAPVTKPKAAPAPITAGQPLQAAKTQVAPVKAMTKDELLAAIKSTVDQEPEVLSFVPQLKKAKDASGSGLYTYEGVRLEDLDKEKLSKVFQTAQQRLAVIKAERVTKQLEMINRTRNIPKAPSLPQLPPKPPSVNTPPPAPPRAPSLPPSPPRR